MKRTISLAALIALFFIVGSGQVAWGQIPQTISYQGVLTNASSTPVPDGNYNLTFKLYDVASGGTALWTEAQTVATRNGNFTVMLGSVTALNLPFDRPYWLGMTVGSDPEMTPRIQLTASAYGLNSKTVLDNAVTSAKILDNTITNADVSATAAIAGTKINPNFGSQNIITTGRVGANDQIDVTSSGYSNRYFQIISGGLQRLSATNDLYIDYGKLYLTASLHFNEGPTERMRIHTGGNVGIGTGSNPTEKLQVVGVIHSTTGGFKFPDGSVQTTAGSGGASLALPFTGNNTSNNDAFTISSTGSGRVANFERNNADPTLAAFRVTNTGGGAMLGISSGSGYGGGFQINNGANTANALEGITNGLGNAFMANHNGASGNIAVFQSGGTNRARIDKNGKGFFNGGTQTGGADVAEAFEVEGSVATYGPGDVLVISTSNDRRVEKCQEPYSTLVAGVYATKAAVLLTERDIEANLDDTVPMGVVGVIPTKVSGENGAIRRGDLLVTASLPGHAMKGTDRSKMLGAVIGKALENFDGNGTGLIRVLVNVK